MRLVLLGLPPSTNNLFATVEGRAVLSTAGRSFHRALHAVALEAMGDRPTSERPYAVCVTYHVGRGGRDVDGSHKVVLDALSAASAPRELTRRKDWASPEWGIWRDDRQVVLLAARRRPSPTPFSYVSIVLRELRALPAFEFPRVPDGAVAFATNDWPPTTNNAYTPVGGVRRKTRVARAVAKRYREGLASLVAHPPAITGSARLRIRYGLRVNLRDVEGSHKLLVDAMRTIVWSDDRAITSFSVAKGRVAKGIEPVIDVATWSLTPKPRSAANPEPTARSGRRR